jgi:ribosome-binding protein aMBF1 (putative translation factor)
MKTDLETVSEQFGRNLAEARGWARLSQGELAERASLQQAQVAKLERGSRCPRLDVIVKLAEVLEVQVRDLLYEIE